MVLFLKNLLFTVLVPGTVAGWGPYWVLTAGGRPLPAPRALVPGLLAGGVGFAIYCWCAWDFAVTGRGTPAPIDAPKRLVVRGLYRYVRNPMYLGVLAVIAGWAVAFRSRDVAAYGAVVALGFHLFVLAVEEPVLRRTFGDEYAAYRAAVGRWLPGRPYAATR